VKHEFASLVVWNKEVRVSALSSGDMQTNAGVSEIPCSKQVGGCIWCVKAPCDEPHMDRAILMLEGYRKITNEGDWQLASYSVDDVFVLWMSEIDQFILVAEHRLRTSTVNEYCARCIKVFAQA
jgi:hypothetical protein